MSGTVTAISLWQPWASLWCSPAKRHETRHWPLSHRGWLVVHAAKRLETGVDDELGAILVAHFGPQWASALPRGALIGAVDLIGCHETRDIVPQRDDYACGDFHFGRYGWERGAFRLFAAPIPYRGQQGLFSVPLGLLPPGWDA